MRSLQGLTKTIVSARALLNCFVDKTSRQIFRAVQLYADEIFLVKEKCGLISERKGRQKR